MIYKRVPPDADLELQQWGNDAAALISTDPAAFGCSSEQSDQLVALTSDFSAKVQACKDPAARTPNALASKSEAKAALLAFARPLMQFIVSNPTIPNDRKRDLSLHIRKPRTPGQKPTNQPDLDLLQQAAESVKFRAHNGDKLVRRVPAGCIGMMVWTHAGPVPPSNFENWNCRGLFTRPTATVSFPGITLGTKVWIAVCWVNRHGQGPMSVPMELTMLGLSIAQQAQQGGEGGMSIAA